MSEITILYSACMYCGAPMGIKDGRGVTGTSHGICESCWLERYPDAPYTGSAEIARLAEAGALALALRERFERLIYPPAVLPRKDIGILAEPSHDDFDDFIIRRHGIIAEARRATRQFSCAHCKEPVMPGVLYYSCTIGGGGLGSIKRPWRVHCHEVDGFLESLRPLPVTEQETK